ncbi:type II secretion system F family protein [Vibrio owensii]|uniref:type II secretion system F family protein n=1 Tax=Vibrio owensii TaxID=696485 RepID=UPI003AB0A1F3
MMSTQTSIFLTLVLITFGVSILIYQLWSSAKRKRSLKGFALSTHHVEQGNDSDTDSMHQAFAQLTASFTSDQGDIKKKLEDAGFDNLTYARYYMHFKYGFAFIGLGATYFICRAVHADILIMMASMLTWFIACIIVPDSYLTSRRKKRQERISKQLPYLLDLMAICVQTGMTLESSIKYLSIELRSFDRELAKVLKQVDDRAQIHGLENALNELYRKLPTSEIRSFVMTLKQSLQYGSSIYAVLTTLASDIRDVNMLTAEEKIGKLAAKMSVPLVVLIMMPIVVVILAPAIMRAMHGL